MDIERLRSAYRDNGVVRAICLHMAERDQSQAETRLHRIQQRLWQDGQPYRLSELIAAFSLLEEAGCGRFMVGGHGWASRFVWLVRSRGVHDVADGLMDAGEIIEEPCELARADELPGDEDIDVVEHLFRLRPHLTVSVELPADLSGREARRLARFVSVLAFDAEA